MNELIKIIPPFPTDKGGSFVSRNTKSNPIQTNYYIKKQETSKLYAQLICNKESSGPPGHVHGGCQAAILDELMGACAWQFEYQVLAVEIKVNFLKMLPIDINIQGVAQIIKTEGRKVFIKAKLFDKNNIYSTSLGTFLMLDSDKIEKLKNLL